MQAQTRTWVIIRKAVQILTIAPTNGIFLSSLKNFFLIRDVKPERQKSEINLRLKKLKNQTQSTIIPMEPMREAQHFWSKLKYHSDKGDMVRQTSVSESSGRARFRSATGTPASQNSSHPWESMIWLIFSLTRLFAPTCGILWEREGF